MTYAKATAVGIVAGVLAPILVVVILALLGVGVAATGGGGIAGSFDIKVDGTSMTWGFSAGNGERVRYDISLTSDGKWKEIGYLSKDDGKTWTKNLEMLLSRKP